MVRVQLGPYKAKADQVLSTDRLCRFWGFAYIAAGPASFLISFAEVPHKSPQQALLSYHGNPPPPFFVGVLNHSFLCQSCFAPTRTCKTIHAFILCMAWRP